MDLRRNKKITFRRERDVKARDFVFEIEDRYPFSQPGMFQFIWRPWWRCWCGLEAPFLCASRLRWDRGVRRNINFIFWHKEKWNLYLKVIFFFCVCVCTHHPSRSLWKQTFRHYTMFPLVVIRLGKATRHSDFQFFLLPCICSLDTHKCRMKNRNAFILFSRYTRGI